MLNGSQLKKRILSRTRSGSKNTRDLNDTLNTTLVNGAINKRESFSLFDHTIEMIGTQLTLLEWVNTNINLIKTFFLYNLVIFYNYNRIILWIFMCVTV